MYINLVVIIVWNLYCKLTLGNKKKGKYNSVTIVRNSKRYINVFTVFSDLIFLPLGIVWARHGYSF